MNILKPLFFIFAFFIISISACANEDKIAKGKAKSVVCATCHGANGIASIPIYPSLAGQNKAYLVNALKAYKDKSRSGNTAAIMTPMVATLSDEDIENLAIYYNSLGNQ